jgi:two-component system, LytTR family, sensor kinase
MLGGTSDYFLDTISQYRVMIKDTLFKTLSIPILGVLIPLLSKLIRYPVLSWLQVVASNMLFIATSYITWQGSVYLVSRVRRLALVKQKFFLKLTMLCVTTSVYSFIVTSISALIWQKLFLSVIDPKPVIACGLISAGVVIFLTLMYEALFLSKERELDMKIVNQLDRERQNAELNSLKGELDPHFVFNALTTLSHLISMDVHKAQLFTNNLAQVYKYLLINKDRELISLNEEIKFINDYFFLLKIRYDNRLKLTLDIDNNYPEKIMIIPCSLQLLVENAIKHNQFSEKEPLQINISLNGEYLRVENKIRGKQYAAGSTKIGLTNLSNRYRLVYNKDIVIDKEQDKFVVRLPLIKQNSL